MYYTYIHTCYSSTNCEAYGRSDACLNNCAGFFLEYQPSGAHRLHHLQNPKWKQGSHKISAPINFSKLSEVSYASSIFLENGQANYFLQE